REICQPSHLGSVVPLDQRSDHVLELSGERGIPLRHLLVFGRLAHVSPLQLDRSSTCVYVTLRLRECHIHRSAGRRPANRSGGRWSRRFLSQADSAWSDRRRCDDWSPTGIGWWPPTWGPPASAKRPKPCPPAPRPTGPT